MVKAGVMTEQQAERARKKLAKRPNERPAMTSELYQRVALRCDLPDHGFRRGDVATLVDRVPHPSGGEAGAVLEVFNALGQSIAVVVVKESEIEPLRSDEVLAVRALSKVG